MSASIPGVRLATFKWKEQTFVLSRLSSSEMQVYDLPTRSLSSSNLTNYRNNVRSFVNITEAPSSTHIPQAKRWTKNIVQFVILEVGEKIFLHNAFYVCVEGRVGDYWPRFMEAAKERLECDLVSGAIMRWSLIELCRLDLDHHATIWFDVSVPFLVDDSAMAAFQIRPQVDKLDEDATEWRRTVGLSEDEAVPLEMSISGYADESIRQLQDLNPVFSFSEYLGSYQHSMHWWNVDLDFPGTDMRESHCTIRITLRLLPHAPPGQKPLWCIDTEGGEERLTEDVGYSTLDEALRQSMLIVEASKWDDWYDSNVDIFKGDPIVDLYIDTNPYVLLDALTPYLWPNDQFLALVKEMRGS